MLELTQLLYHYTIYAHTQQARKALSWAYRASTSEETIERLHEINDRAWKSFMEHPVTLPGVDEIIDACTKLLSL